MTIVKGTVTAPGGVASDPAARRVRITLVDHSGRARVGYTSEQEIVGVTEMTADVNGRWQADLVPNADIVTDWGDSLYRVEQGYDPDLRQAYVYYISVTEGAGPYHVGDLRTAPTGVAAAQGGSADQFLPLVGGTLKGPLALAGAPASDMHAATKAYVDSAVDDQGGTAPTLTSLGAASAADLTAHTGKTTDVHGIADAAALETKTGSAAKVTAHSQAADAHGDRAAAASALSSHASGQDPHGDRAAAASALASHAGGTDPHGDRAAAASALSGHASGTDPHGDRAFTTTAISNHSGGSDPHGDRAAASSALAGHASGSDPHGDRAVAASALAAHASGNDPHGDRAAATAALNAHTHPAQVAVGIATIPSLNAAGQTTVQVTLKPTLASTAYTATAVVTGTVSLLAALSVQSVAAVSGSRADVVVKNTGLVTLAGGQVQVTAVMN